MPSGAAQDILSILFILHDALVLPLYFFELQKHFACKVLWGTSISERLCLAPVLALHVVFFSHCNGRLADVSRLVACVTRFATLTPASIKQQIVQFACQASGQLLQLELKLPEATQPHLKYASAVTEASRRTESCLVCSNFLDGRHRNEYADRLDASWLWGSCYR